MEKLCKFQDFYRDTLTYKCVMHLLENTSLWFATLGSIGISLIQSVKSILKGDVNIKNTIEQCARVGFDSLPITLAMVGVSGMIIALQVAQEMVKQGAGDYVGSLVAVSIVREIGPIMGSFAVISMVGSSMAAELGTMQVTEQIDAVKVSGVDPVSYLIVPRVLAGLFIMPFVITLACLMGIIGGLFTAKVLAGLSAINYLDSVWNGLSENDVYVTLLKACIFGVIITLTSSSIGFSTSGGAMEVGKSTTKAVVWAFVSVVVADYIISLLFFG